MGDPYVAPTYEAVSAVRAFNAVPRFGNVGDITDIFTADGGIDTQKVISYAQGVIFIFAFFASTYIVFILLSAAFKCCCKGDGHMRILSGRPFLDRGGSSMYSNIMRGFLLFCSIVVIASGGVYLTKGTESFKTLISDVRDVTDGFTGLTTKLNTTATNFIDFGEETVPLRDSLVDLVDQGICSSFNGGNNQENTDFDDAASVLVAILNTIQEFAKSDITTIKDSFSNDILGAIDNVKTYTDTAENQLNVAYYAGPTIIFGVIFMIGIILAFMSTDVKIYFLIQKWGILTLFFLFISATMLIASTVGTVLVFNSDICIGSGSPEGFVASLADQFLDETTKNVMNYYIISGCTSDYVDLLSFTDMLSQLDEATAKSTDLQVILAQNKADFEVYCGGGAGSLDTLELVLDDAVIAFDNLNEIGKNTTDLLACEGINGIWVDIMHDAVCSSSPTSLAWMFASMAAIYSVGIFIFLFRGALQPTEFENYQTEETSTYKKEEPSAYEKEEQGIDY